MISKTGLPFLHRSTSRHGPSVRARALSPAFLFSLTSSLALATAAAAATPARYQLHIASKARSEALIDLGVQARVTLGGAQACVGKGPGLSGAMTLRQALSKLTAGGCQFEILDAATVRVTALPRPTPTPAVRLIAVVHDTAAIDEVVVTATKRRTRLRSAPGGISVVGSGRLIDTGAVDTTSISQQTAGFFTTNLGAARNKIMLRGLSDGTFTGRTQQTVATYLDNIPLTYNAPDPDLRLIDVERIEVLRGPQGSLYGSGSLSGVYRIVSRKPDLEAMSGFALASIAATESGSPSQTLEGVPCGWRPIATPRAVMSTTSICVCRTWTAPLARAFDPPWPCASMTPGRSACQAPGRIYARPTPSTPPPAWADRSAPTECARPMRTSSARPPSL
jgi:iron complex outermembrane receptor protein